MPRIRSWIPQVNRARTQGEQADPDVPLHIVGESREGLVVSGARMLATLAPYADELMVFPSPSRTHPTDAPRYAFAFAVPMAISGLKFICGAEASMPAAQPAITRSRLASMRWTRSPCSTRWSFRGIACS